jgi:hypothetical protein
MQKKYKWKIYEYELLNIAITSKNIREKLEKAKKILWINANSKVVEKALDLIIEANTDFLKK